MPYRRSFYPGRRMGARFGPNRFVPAQQNIWVDTGASTTALAATTVLNDDLLANLTADFDVTNRSGLFLKQIVGTLLVYSPTAIAAGVNASVIAGFLINDQNTTAANQDPYATSGRHRPWLHQFEWPQPFTAAPIAANFTIPLQRNVNIRFRKPVRIPPDYTVFMVKSNTGGTGGFNVFRHLRLKIVVP